MLILRKISLKNILEYLLIITVILQCNSVFFRAVGKMGLEISLLSVGLIMLLALVSIIELFTRTVKINKLAGFSIIYLIYTTSFLMIINSQYKVLMQYYLGKIILPILVVIYFFNEIASGRNAEFFLKFLFVVKIMAVISLLFWIINFCGVPTNSSINIIWGSPRIISGYFNIHYLAQGSISFLGLGKIPRNTGIFTEAPMYSFILSIALLISIFLKRKNANLVNREQLLLMFTIFTTTSTTGVTVCLLAFLVNIILSSGKINMQIQVIIFLLLIPLAYLGISFFLTTKVDSNWYSSSSLRENDIMAAYTSWKLHPFFGNGIGNLQVIIQYMDARRWAYVGNSGFSSGLMKVLSDGGLAGLGLYIFPVLFAFTKSKKVGVFGVFLLLLLMVTIVDDSYIVTMILGYMWALYIAPKTFYKNSNEENSLCKNI